MSTVSSVYARLSRPFVRKPQLHDGRFPFVDALRAIAALSIVVFHFNGYMSLPPALEWFHPVVVRLGAGVLVFFVISGFLIYRPFVRANLSGAPRPEVIGYAKRRFLRIVPAYFLALTLTAALVGKTDVFGPDGFLYYGFAQIYQQGLELKGLSVAWSLCIEVTLYAFLPIWAMLVAMVPASTPLDRRRREVVMLVLLLALGIAARVMMANSQGRVGSVSILAYLDIFALGMVMAYWSVAWEGRALPRWLSWINDYPGISWAGAAVCLWAMATQTGGNKSAFQVASTPDLWLRHGLSAMLGVLLLLPLAFGDQRRGRLRQVLGNPVLLWAGVVSYGLYLFHPLVLRKLDDAGAMPASGTLLGWAGMLLLVVAITAVIAALSWHFLERPLLMLRDAPLLSKDRPPLPLGPRVVIGIGGAGLVLAGIDGTSYEFIDFVLVASGLFLIAGVVPPRGRRRPAVGLLAGVGAVAVVFGLIPGVLSLTRPERANANASPFPQRAFLVGTSSGDKLSIYLNGKLVATGSGPGSIGPSAAPFEIGGVKGNKGWNGSIDSVAAWNRVLDIDQIRKLYFAGSKTGGTPLGKEVASTSGLVRWYPLGDLAKGPRDSVTGKRGKVVGRVAATTGHVAIGDVDGGAIKVIGDGRVSTAPLLKMPLSKMTVAAWVQNGPSVSNRVIMGAQEAWLLKTDIAGHWSFGVKDGRRGYTILSPQSAQRFIPGAAQQARSLGSKSEVSVVGVIAAILALGAALLLVPSVRRGFFRLFSGSTSA